MSRIADFNIVTSRHKHRNINDCSVVINNNNSSTTDAAKKNESVPPYPSSVVYPSVSLTPDLSPEIVARGVTVDDNDNDYELALYKMTSTIKDGILKTNNIKMLANVLDTSGKIIIGAEDLVKTVGLACSIPSEKVNIKYIAVDGTCCGKINPVRSIDTIKVDNQDMVIAFNDKYNMIENKFNISLKRVVIPNSFDN